MSGGVPRAVEETYTLASLHPKGTSDSCALKSTTMIIPFLLSYKLSADSFHMLAAFSTHQQIACLIVRE